MRCLALAHTLRENGADVLFLCRRALGDLGLVIENWRFPVCWLPQSGSKNSGYQHDVEQIRAAIGPQHDRVDWLIVDHYGLNGDWESRSREFANHVMVIDDLANREHDCDLLLDQNLRSQGENRHRALIPSKSRLLVGPQYALLRPEFTQERAKLKLRNGAMRRILVFFGGSDPSDETSKALTGLQEAHIGGIELTVVVGSSNPHRDKVKNLCESIIGTHYLCQVDTMARVMAHADVAIGGGGTATWERCCIGLPSIVAVLADNQRELVAAVSDQGSVLSLGSAETLVPDDYAQAIETTTLVQRARMEKLALVLVDGLGTSRVAEELVQV